MNLPKIKFNLAHGFPTDWPTGQLEHKIISKHLENNNYDLVVNQTWGFLECENPVTKEKSDKFKVFEYLVTNKLANSVLFFNFVDPIYDLSTWYEVFDRCKKVNVDFKITCMGQIDSNKIELQHPLVYWAVFASDNFKNYTEEETAPTTFKNLFLCYNRKPHWHRKMLYEQMIKHEVIEKGIFTLGNQDEKQIKLINTDKITLPSDNKKMHGELGIPNDTMTLGDLQAWNSHLVTIVTETQHVSKIGFPFFSEKIWKPMIGMRPFLLLGDAGSTRYLKDNGFHAFNDLFGIRKDDATIADVVSAIKLFDSDPAEVYDSILPKLRHNKKRFYEFANEQKKIFDL